ncbi:BrxA family protein [Nostoc sp. DSM 114159]
MPVFVTVTTMTETAYAARTNHAFVLTETLRVAELMYQGATQEDIRQRVLVDDLFQLRSQVSRERALQTVLKRLQQVPEEYIQLIATSNPDTRRFTILFLILQEHRLLRELIAEVLLDKIKGFDYVVTTADLRTFFEGKRDQNSTVAAWSNSTYKKAVSNTLLVLVNAGLLQPTSPKGNYQIRSVPVPSALRQQLLADGLAHYLTLMLDF